MSPQKPEAQPMRMEGLLVMDKSCQMAFIKVGIPYQASACLCKGDFSVIMGQPIKFLFLMVNTAMPWRMACGR